MDPLAISHGPRPKVCVVSGCEGRHYARGLCRPHYRQEYNAGRLEPLNVEAREDRFRRLYEVSEDGCWLWTGALNSAGYGVFDARGRWMAHRWSWEQVNGPIPEGLDLDHTCHNSDPSCPGAADCAHRRCVNPAHLDPVTRAENLRRSTHTNSGRPPATHCKWGHPLSGDNLLVTGGRKRCRTCAKQRLQEFNQRRKAALNGVEEPNRRDGD